MPNLSLSGNPRYQPKDLVPTIGYDNLAKPIVEVEIATMSVLADIGKIPQGDMVLLTPDVEQKLLEITTTQMDLLERKLAHDIRALVRLMQEALPEPLRRWVHVPLTSYDPLDTARTLLFIRMHDSVVRPKAKQMIALLAQKARRYANTVQIGRTHGQHALFITVGFWLATILSRMLFNASKMDESIQGLVGKISGAVGACNAQVGLQLTGGEGPSFEERVLSKLGLKAAPISTQILPSEPLAYYLFATMCMSASLGQFGRDCRHLMRTEIGEVAEPFGKDQVGSSTMAHKRNPVTFEGLEGAWFKNIGEFVKVLLTLISEHQRDLVGSSISRDFPTIIVNLVTQLDALLRKNDDGLTFIERMRVDEAACARNAALLGDTTLAEPMYLALQFFGYAGDAHEIVNREAMPLVGPNRTLVQAIEFLAANDSELADAWNNIPRELHLLFRNPTQYTGLASQKCLAVCARADAYLEVT